MPSPMERRATARNRTPAAPVSTDSVDGVPGVDLDTNDDLMDQLIIEAGSADPDAILETGLPEDYDPDPIYSGGTGAIGQVFKIDTGPVEDTPRNTTGSTRVGVLPKLGTKAPALVPARTPAARQAAQEPPPPPPERDEAEEVAEGELEGLSDTLPEEPAAVRTPARSASSDIDQDVLAELSGAGRTVSTTRPPEPPPPARPAPSPAPVPMQPREGASMPDQTSPPSAKRVLLIDPNLPGLERLRWEELIATLRSKPIQSPRAGNRKVDLWDVPDALFERLLSHLTLEFGHGVALSSVSHMETGEVLVCTRAVFDLVLQDEICRVTVDISQLARDLDRMENLLVDLRLLQAAKPPQP